MNSESSIPQSLRELSSEQLTLKLAELVAHERMRLVDFLWHLAELDRRRLYLDLAYSSLFVYCVKALKMPESTAYRRSSAACLLARFPVLESYLRDGRLSPTTLAMLEKVLTPENVIEVIERAAGKTQKEVERLAVEFRPRPVLKDSIRRLPAGTYAAEAPPPAPVPSTEPSPAATASLFPDGPVVAPPPPRPKVEPVTAALTSIRMTVGEEFMEVLEQARSALSHIVPDGNLEKVLRICMERTVEQCARRTRAATKRTSTVEVRPEETSNGDCEPRIPGALIVACAIRQANSTSTVEVARAQSRYIPAAVRRAVWERDGGRCTFVGPDGRRCDSTHQLELDHIRPVALGGKATADDLRVRCRPHNIHWARLVFGDEHMDKFLVRKRPDSERGRS